MKIVAVVVTYNRCQLLQKTINCLFSTPGLDGVVVVNNCSTDGTREWLDALREECLTVIHQANVGGAGGFATGMKRAHEMGADWVWCMDDDVFPRPECLAHLVEMTSWPGVGIMSPRRLVEGKVFTTEFKGFQLTGAFASTSIEPLRRLEVTEPVEIAGAAFEGLFISRRVIDTIGYPNTELFIFYDDTDYCLRALQAGFKILYVPGALMDKHRFFAAATWLERTRAKRWKRFYQVRNGAWFASTYGKTWRARHVRSFVSMLGYLLPAFFLGLVGKGYLPGDAWRFVRARREGLKGHLGKMKLD